jgi:multidrug efflux pump subunit AcrB
MANNSPSYLERLKFDPKLLIGPVAAWVTNIRVVILLVLTILFLGLFSYFNIPRRLNPEINLPIITVVTALPGASPEDVESLVTIPLESQLQSVSNLDTIASTSQNNVSVISMQFLSQVTSEKAKSDVQSIVDSVTDLPTDAQIPKVTALDFEDRPIWTFTVSGDHDIPSLMRFSDTLKKNIENQPKIDRATVTGFEDQQISITFNPAKISLYNINPLQLSNLVKTSISSFPAGPVNTNTNTFAFTIEPTATNVSHLRNLKLNVNGTTIVLGDIATVNEISKTNQNWSMIADNNNVPKRVVTFNVYKTSNSNFDDSVNNAKKIVESTNTSFQNRFKITTILNAADEINKQFFDLLDEFKSTILLVMACLFVFLGLRQALISSVTVPLTFLSAFIFMRIFGMSINFLSLFAFLLALGLLVDDTIVTVSAMTSYYKSGKFTPTQTGLIVWRDTIVPIWSTTITTIWSFVPLLLASGIIGEFIKPIPVVVTVTMISSTAIAVLITLPFMIVILKPSAPKRVILLIKIILAIILFAFGLYIVRNNTFFALIAVLYILLAFIFIIVRKSLAYKINLIFNEDTTLLSIKNQFFKYLNHGLLDIEILSQKYKWLITKILASGSARKKVIIAIIIYAVWAFALLPLGLVKNEFFPKTDEDLVYVTLEMPPGTNLTVTQTKSNTVLEKLRHIPEAQFVVEETGTGLTNMGGATNKANNSLFTIHLPDKKLRHRSSILIAEDLRNQFKNYTDGKITVTELTSGPPAGADLQIKLLGDDLAQLNTYADKIIAYLNTQNGVTNADKSIKPGPSQIVFVPDEAKVAQAGLTNDAIGLWMRTYASGFTLGSVKFQKDSRVKEDVVFTFAGGIQNPSSIGQINIPTQTGFVPLLSLGTLKTQYNPTSITRESGKRTISVSAIVKPGYSVSTKGKDLEKFADSLKLPEGYSWETGGINEENAKSVQSILQSMVLAFILILVTMVIQFKSYRQAIIVLMVIPLAVSSVFAAFALTGTPLSFPALIGILSLFGIVVTNSMFIVDKINLNRKQGMQFNEAIADAGASRMEPIILTKLCTVFGLLPITLSNPLWQGLGGAIISGLLIASTIMLLFIPVVYYEWFKGEKEIKQQIKVE